MCPHLTLDFKLGQHLHVASQSGMKARKQNIAAAAAYHIMQPLHTCMVARARVLARQRRNVVETRLPCTDGDVNFVEAPCVHVMLASAGA